MQSISHIQIEISYPNTIMKTVHVLVVFVLLALTSPPAFASDPAPLQDFCVAINNTVDGGVYSLNFC